MKNATDHAKKLGPLIKKLAKQYPVVEDSETTATRDPVSHVIYAFLEWEATSKLAATAIARFEEIAVDHNDLRVCHTAELTESMGAKYPRVEERAARLREVLNGIYMLEHDTSLEGIADKSKRDIRNYLDSLPGMVPYVAARTVLMAFGGHAIPVDERLVSLLEQEKVIEPDATVDEVTSFLDRNIKASDGLETHLIFRRWADEAPAVKMKKRKVVPPKPVKVAEVKEEAEVEVEAKPAKSSKSAKASTTKSKPKAKTSSKATAASKSKVAKTTKKKVTKKAPSKAANKTKSSAKTSATKSASASGTKKKTKSVRKTKK